MRFIKTSLDLSQKIREKAITANPAEARRQLLLGRLNDLISTLWWKMQKHTSIRLEELLQAIKLR